MQIYFLLAAVFPTVILGSPVADGPIPSLENIMSFLPQDLAPNPDHITYPDALQSQNSNDQTFEYFAVPDQQQTGPNFAFDMALAPSSQGEKVDDETAKYREFNCQESYSVCCQGSDPSRSSQHKSCSEKSTNQYAGREDVGSKDMRYGQYCYNPFYTTACDDSLVTMLQDVKGMTCYTDCQITEVIPQKAWTVKDIMDSIRDGIRGGGGGSPRNFQWRRF